MNSRLLEAPSLILSSHAEIHEVTSQNRAQSTELAEYMRKTVLESEIDSLGEKLHSAKLRVKIPKIFRNSAKFT